MADLTQREPCRCAAQIDASGEIGIDCGLAADIKGHRR